MRFVSEEWIGEGCRIGLVAELAEALAERGWNFSSVPSAQAPTPAADCLTRLIVHTMAASKPAGRAAPSLPERARAVPAHGRSVR